MLHSPPTPLPAPRPLRGLGALLGASPAMQRIYDLIARVAPTGATVLLSGESGTGKELVAATLHELSARRAGPFLALNCGAVPPNVIESELFGHEKGSFTGATQRHAGYFERAAGGTLFLDEITEMHADMQVKLLRVLESGSLCRVGGERDTPLDARLVAATNRPPLEAVAQGRFREDLYWRLKVFEIHLPPLRERPGDVLLLAGHFLEEMNREGRVVKELTEEAKGRLATYGWPGNVREMKNVLQAAWILSDGEIGVEVLGLGKPELSFEGEGCVMVGMTLKEAERRLITGTLERCSGNRTRAARVLGISLKTLYNKLKAYGSVKATGIR